MTELEIKIIKFLLSSAVYSENAIMKNLGIDKTTLDKSFKILEEYGYLESYDNFIKKESLNEDNDCCNSNKHCSSCSSSTNCCDKNIFKNLEDFSKIKVITMKAVDKFS